jgi:hypothetical protein
VQPTTNLVHLSGNKHGVLTFEECRFVSVSSKATAGGGVVRVDGDAEVNSGVLFEIHLVLLKSTGDDVVCGLRFQSEC